jgi:hypothetical protein
MVQMEKIAQKIARKIAAKIASNDVCFLFFSPCWSSSHTLS